MELGQQQENLRKLGLGAVPVSYDSDAVWQHFLRRKGLTYSYIADTDSKLIDAFGLRNTAVNVDFMQGIPHPGVYFLDRQGIVQAKYFEEDFREQFTIASLLTGRFGLRAGAAQSTVTGKRIEVTTAAASAVVRGGQRLSLQLTARLAPGLHVYAPGAPEDFIPVAWTIEGAKAGEVSWPKPDAQFLYSGAFTATREVTLPQRLDAEQVELRGTFRYQACTDKICYPPETIPLSWKFIGESLDRERVPAGLRRK